MWLPTNSFPFPSTQVLAKHAGQDVTHLFYGKQSGFHAHSSGAHQLLANYYIADVTTIHGAAPPKRNESSQMIDESQPLLCQVGSLGPRYMEWIHHPVSRHPRFFVAEWAEAITKVRWWVVPLLWLPVVVLCLLKASMELPFWTLAAYACIGLVAWQGLEYMLHRFLFHLVPRGSTSIFLHFLLHGNHHKYPMDTERLVFPPIPASLVVLAVYSILHAVFVHHVATAIFGGMLGGYVVYDCMHYGIHSGLLTGSLAKAHMRHHFEDTTTGFGISSPLFDWLLGTLPHNKRT